MQGVNKCLFIGRLGSDPKMNYTQSGQPVVNFSIACDESYKDKATGQRVEKTEWVKIQAWGQVAEFCGNYLAKGRLVFVEGKLQTRKWQGQDGQDRYTTEIVARQITALDRAPDQQQGQCGPPQGQPPRFPDEPGANQASGNRYGQDEDLGPRFPTDPQGMDSVPF